VSDLPLISVCIPIFNSDANSLVNSLFEQVKNLENKIEIIVIDDCSDHDWKLKNNSIIDFCRFVQLPQNIGRSKIRNLFLKYAKGEFLLFIDGDSEVISKCYLTDYVDFIEKNNPDVLVGGSVYQKEKPKRSHLLRWKYSILRESKPAEKREAGNLGFKTNNFLIRKRLFSETQFDEKLMGYGHEDTLFGIQLARQKHTIQHLENPVLNKHLDSNKVFVKKTENAVGNLVQIYLKVEQFPEIQEIKLIRFYEKMKQQKLISFIDLTYRITSSCVMIFLKSGFFTLWMFDFYKLGLFIRKIKS
jgi:glycosyltransferase involved in cell wall biosynthesis